MGQAGMICTVLAQNSWGKVNGPKSEARTVQSVKTGLDGSGRTIQDGPLEHFRVKVDPLEDQNWTVFLNKSHPLIISTAVHIS